MAGSAGITTDGFSTAGTAMGRGEPKKETTPARPAGLPTSVGISFRSHPFAPTSRTPFPHPPRAVCCLPSARLESRASTKQKTHARLLQTIRLVAAGGRPGPVQRLADNLVRSERKQPYPVPSVCRRHPGRSPRRWSFPFSSLVHRRDAENAEKSEGKFAEASSSLPAGSNPRSPLLAFSPP